jgi:hypothetical protein
VIPAPCTSPGAGGQDRTPAPGDPAPSLVAERAAFFASWHADGFLQPPSYWQIAYLLPVWERSHGCGRAAWDSYLNAAAIRLITQGESA